MADDPTCADCGAKLVNKYGRWANKLAEGEFSYTCRITLQGARLISADYHHLEGEEQRHFRDKDHRVDEPDERGTSGTEPG